MPAIEYPAALPGPAVAPVTPAERRRLSDLPGPRAAAVMQRDYLAAQRVEWPPMSRAELAVFRAWWHDTLFEGGAWFSATWPLPQGLVVGVRKFLGEPQRRYLGNGFWKLSAFCEVRGRGELPQTIDTLLLINGIDDIVDESPFGWSITNVGVEIVDGAMYFDGSSYLLVDVGAPLNRGSGDWNIEFEANKDVGSSVAHPFAGILGSNTDSYGADTSLIFSATDGDISIDGPLMAITTATGGPEGSFRHYAFSRAGDTQRSFDGGGLDATVIATESNELRLVVGGLSIGHVQAGYGPVPPGAANTFFQGYLRGIRILRRALYTEPFTPPALPLAVI